MKSLTFLSPIVLAICVTYPTLVLSDSPSSSISSSGSHNSPIPRSHHRHSQNYYRFPPWNPSPRIDDNGFLKNQYRRIKGEWEQEIGLRLRKRNRSPVQIPATIRQVPGDGNCLFHSISCCLEHAVNGTHVDLKNADNLRWLYASSAKLRQEAIDCLEQRKTLFLQGEEEPHVPTKELVEAAAAQYGITAAEYCELMRQDSVWGGGPEICALVNVLQRPIHVYELCAKGNSFVLRRMACFGSPKFDRQKALHILSADSRFPDLTPGKQLAAGNHFLAMFPEEKEVTRKKYRKVRGGDTGWLSLSSSSSNSGDKVDVLETAVSTSFSITAWFKRLFRYFLAIFMIQ